MADDKSTSSTTSSTSTGKSAKSAATGVSGLAPVEGTYNDPGSAEETAGTPAHLGSDRPYEGASPEGE